MLQVISLENNSAIHSVNWEYAHGLPQANARLKAQPEDFKVTELLDIELVGEGEHCWIWLTKRLQNTEQVAKELAKFAGVSFRDVSYSGMKDFQAVTSQWFSVWLPGKADPDWSNFTMDGVIIEKTIRHTRKLKRGAHRANQFQIVLQELDNAEAMEQPLSQIIQMGVPNYFGEQRFGRERNNISHAITMFADNKLPKSRHKRSLYLSAARSWLFNLILSERVQRKSWNSLLPDEPVNLDGTNSVFTDSGDDSMQQRLEGMDIHPTVALWGRGHNGVADSIRLFEEQAVSDFQLIAEGLEKAGLKHERRATRIKLEDFHWDINNSQCFLEFVLHKGQFATSVLRECVNTQ